MRRLPMTARILLLLVVAGGAMCLGLRVPDVARWTGTDATVFVLLTVGIVLAEQFQIPVRFGAETLNCSLTEALWVGVLLHSRPSVVTLAVATGIVAGQAARRWAAHKVAFNAGQFLLALTAAEAVVGALRSPELLQPATFLAAGLGMAVYAAINAGLVAGIISLASGQRLRSVLVPTLPENALHFAVNTALGLAAAVLWQAAPASTPVLVLPLAMSFLAYRVLLEAAEAGELLREPAGSSA
jgi:hypothetical protein